MSLNCSDGADASILVPAGRTDLTLPAAWQGDTFSVSYDKEPIFSCQKGSTLTAEIQAGNNFYVSDTSDPAEISAMGLPGPVVDLETREVIREARPSPPCMPTSRASMRLQNT